MKTERAFVLWEYTVSHSRLRLRSPKTAEETKLDIVFRQVRYLDLPRFLSGLEILEAGPDEIRELESRIPITRGSWFPTSPPQWYILCSGGKRYYVSASGFHQEDADCESEEDRLDDSFLADDEEKA